MAVCGVTTAAVGAGKVGAVVLVGSGVVGMPASVVAVPWGPPEVTMSGGVAVGMATPVGEAEQAASRQTPRVVAMSFKRIVDTSCGPIRIVRQSRIARADYNKGMISQKWVPPSPSDADTHFWDNTLTTHQPRK